MQPSVTDAEIQHLKQSILQLQMPDFAKRLILHLINETELLTKSVCIIVLEKWCPVPVKDGLIIPIDARIKAERLIKLINPQFVLSARRGYLEGNKFKQTMSDEGGFITFWLSFDNRNLKKLPTKRDAIESIPIPIGNNVNELIMNALQKN